MYRYGELEKYLGQKYAQEIAQSGWGPIGQECSEILNNSLQVLEFYNKLDLAIKAQRFVAAVR